MSRPLKNNNNYRDGSPRSKSNFKSRNKDQRKYSNLNSLDKGKSSDRGSSFIERNKQRNNDSSSEFNYRNRRDNSKPRRTRPKENMPSYSREIDNSSSSYSSSINSQRIRPSNNRERYSMQSNSQVQRKTGENHFNLSESSVSSSQEANDLIWGRHASQAAFETGRPIHRIWCTTEIRSSSKFFQFLRDAKTSGVLVEEVSWARLAQITKGAVHQGIALQTASAETIDLDKLIKACSSLNESALLLALDGLTDPHNLGAIIRSAEALGAHGLVLPQRRSAGLTGSVAKVAAGALEHLPVARVVNLNRSLVKLKDEGYQIIGLAEEGESTLQEANLDGPLVVVIGSEDKGISLLTRKHCDQLIRIPLRGITTSLNASIATSVVLYEIARKTWMKRISGQSPSPKLLRAKFSFKEN